MRPCACDDLHGHQLFWQPWHKADGTGDGYWQREGAPPRIIPFGGKCRDCGREAPPTPACPCRVKDAIISEPDGRGGHIFIIECEPDGFECEGNPPRCPFCNREFVETEIVMEP